MGAPKGNQFWKQRSKHGRDKIFSSPEILWQEACKYFEWVDANPLIESQLVNKPYTYTDVNGATQTAPYTLANIPKMRPYTWSGLELFLGVSRLKHYKNNEKYKDFLPVIEQIDNVLYTQKFEGAAAGFLKENIIARDLGLTDKQDITSDGKEIKQNVIEFAGKKIKI